VTHTPARTSTDQANLRPGPVTANATTVPPLNEPLRRIRLVPRDPAKRLDRRGPDSCPDAPALLRRAQAGDTDAFTVLYLAYRDQVTRYVAARMRDRDRDAVPDLVQDAFCDAFAELPNADPNVRGWLMRLAARACTRHGWRARRWFRAVYTVRDELTRAVPAPYPGHQPAALAGSVRLDFTHALARLAPGQRQAIQLRYLDGLPRDHAARHMDRTPNAVRMLERRALRRLHATHTSAETLASAHATRAGAAWLSGVAGHHEEPAAAADDPGASYPRSW